MTVSGFVVRIQHEYNQNWCEHEYQNKALNTSSLRVQKFNMVSEVGLGHEGKVLHRLRQ